MADFTQVSSKNVSSFTAKNAYDDVFGGASKHGIPSFSSRVEDYTDIFSARNSSSSRVSSIPFLDLPVVAVDETNDVWSSSKFDYSEIFGGGLCHSVDYAIPYEELFLQPKSGFPAEIVSPQEVSSEDPVCLETNEAFLNLESHYAYDCGKQFNVSYHKTNQVSNEDGIRGATHIAQLNAIPAYTFVVDETLPLHTAKCDISLPEVANHKSLNGNTDLRMDGEHFREDMSPQPACGSAMKSQKNFDGKGASDKKPFPILTEVGLKTHPTEVPPPSREPPKLIIKKGSHKLMSSDVKYSTKYSRQSAAAPLSFDVDIDSSSSTAASVAAMKEAMEIAQVRLKSAKELMERKKDGLQNRKKMDMKDTARPERSEVKITHDVRDKEVNSHLNVQRKNSKLKGSDMKEHRLTHASDQEDIIGEWKAEELFYELVKKDTVGEVGAPKHKKSEGNSIPTTRAYEHDKTERLTFDQQEENYERLQAANRVCVSLDKKRPIEAMEAYEKANHEAKVRAAQRLLDRELHEQRQKESHELRESEKKLVQEDHEKAINETHEQETKEACEREEHERKLKLLHEQEEHERQRKETFEREEKMKEALRRKDDERRQREAQERGEKERKQMARERRQKEMREKEENEKKEDEKRQEAFQRDENERRQNEAREIEENAKRIKESYERQETERRLKQAAEEDERRLKQVLEVEENQRRQKEARAKEENEKIQQALQREENDRRQQEARKIEENEKRLKESHERQEKEKKLKQAAEEDERRLKQIIEMEEIQSRQKEHEREENEKRLKESHETEQNERKLRQAEREENEKRLKESFEREENELKLKRTAEEDARRLEQVLEMEENQRKQKEREREENQKRLKECHEKEENERKLKQSTEENERKVKQIAEENEMRLREVIERIHTGEHESEETEKRLKDSSEKGDNKWKRKQPTVENERIVIEVHEQEENEKRQKEILGHEDDKRSLKEYHSDAVTEKLLQEETCESAENEKKLRDPQELNESKMRPEESHKWEEKDKKSEEASCQEEIKETHNKAFEWEEKEQHKLSQDFHVHNEDKNLQTETVFEEMAECEEKLKSGNDASMQDEIKSPKATCGLIQEPNNEKLKIAQALFEKVKVDKLRATNLVQSSSDLEECKDSQVAALMTMVDDIEMELGESEDTVSVKKDQVGLNCKDGKRSIEVSQRVGQCSDDRTKFEAVQLINEEGKIIKPKLANEINTNQEKKANSFSGNFAREASVKEGRMLKDKELEKEHLRKLEEHKDREREREKDRVAVERVTREARERAFTEARERAERAAVERATAEARQRAMIEARERLEKACAEAREKSLAEKAYTESKLRAERAAVERATAEARERAVEKAISERAAVEGRERVERSVSEKFSAASRDGGLKQTSSFSDIWNAQFQSSSTFSSSQKYPKSSNHGASNNKAQETEVESAQRCKARLERHQRTVERSVKALAEKNLRDNLAQRELTEKNRLGEVLDADVKRWSSGKEGNLRALLSTLQYILGSESGWQPIPLTDIVTAVAVKKAYRKATLCVHPDKLQQRGASIQQKYVCEKVFDLLKDAWTKFNSEER